MPKKIDLTGEIFGKLHVISQAPSRFTPKGKPITMWLCRCECGNEKVIAGQSLRRGMTKSCGCLTDVDLSGKRVGHLLVLNQVESNKKKCRQWLWRYNRVSSESSSFLLKK